MPNLRYRDLQDQNHTLALVGKRLRIGRAQGCWLVLDSERVSRVHSELICNQADKWTIADLGSVNGTLVNGQTIDAPHQLSADDVIDVGGFQLHFNEESEPVEAEIASGPIHGFASTDTAQKKQIATDASAQETVNALLDEAVQRRASDLHIEPTPAGIRIRMRIDGILEQVHALPVSAAASLISRIKVMARLNIAEKRAPQDGRFRHTTGNLSFDIRVAIIPTVLGERITLRLLALDRSRQGLKSLGMNQTCRKTMTGLIRQPHGIILITGPTGSGKTTTLYSAMNLINDVTKHIITVENPVEYSIEGINQIQISSEARITFASALRSILRHDPDVIMVGEIRDQETAHLALEASLTGHLVFATLHTNSACGALTRLLDIGAEPYLIASGVMACLAQRLVRCICLDCKETYQPSEEELAYCQLPDDAKPVQLARGTGCSSCRGSGYSDRVGLFEIAAASPALGQLIMSTAPTSQMQQLVVDEGMTTLRQDGVAKACAGITTLAEVIRVTRD